MSNRLPVLEKNIADACSAIQMHERSAAEKAIDAGHDLIEAKSLTKHGEWLPFLKRAGISERKAQQYMQLARSGLNAQRVADLGGIRTALEYLSTVQEINGHWAEAVAAS